MLKSERKADLSDVGAAPFPSERELLDGLRRGDEAAARQFYDGYAPRLSRFIYQALGAGSPADAEDLLQESLMAIAEALPYFRGDCSLFTFACSIARRKVASFIRHNQQRGRLGAALAVESRDASREGGDPSDTMAALGALTPEHREVLILKYVEGLAVAEIATILKLTEHAVESRLARARRALGKRLGVM